MARWSFGLRQLFFWTAAIALGLVALRSASATWAAGMLALTFVTLISSILFAVFRQGPRQAFWMGFATFGWAYLLLLLASWTLGRNTSHESPLRADNLLTQQLSSSAYHWLYDQAWAQYQAISTGAVFFGPLPGGGYMSSGVMPADAVMSGSGYDSGEMAGGMGSATPGGPAPPAALPPIPELGNFLNVAHALWTLLFAALGGCLAWWLYMTGPGRLDQRATAAPEA